MANKQIQSLFPKSTDISTAIMCRLLKKVQFQLEKSTDFQLAHQAKDLSIDFFSKVSQSMMQSYCFAPESHKKAYKLKRNDRQRQSLGFLSIRVLRGISKYKPTGEEAGNQTQDDEKSLQLVPQSINKKQVIPLRLETEGFQEISQEDQNFADEMRFRKKEKLRMMRNVKLLQSKKLASSNTSQQNFSRQQQIPYTTDYNGGEIPFSRKNRVKCSQKSQFMFKPLLPRYKVTQKERKNILSQANIQVQHHQRHRNQGERNYVFNEERYGAGFAEKKGKKSWIFVANRCETESWQKDFKNGSYVEIFDTNFDKEQPLTKTSIKSSRTITVISRAKKHKETMKKQTIPSNSIPFSAEVQNEVDFSRKIKGLIVSFPNQVSHFSNRT